MLMTTGADCPPVLFYDPIKQAVGNIHVGWRGLLQGIVFNAVEILKNKCGCKAENINVFIGPGLESCHFEVGDDVAEQFIEDYKEFITGNNNKKQVDLKGIIKFILLNNGIKNDNIDVSPDCTFCCGDLYSSHRREGKGFKAMGGGYWN
ncbi:MAG: polyphenol oxidase family protein [bacterium]